MDKVKLKELLDRQIFGLADYMNGYKACAKYILDSYEEKKETHGTPALLDAGNTEVA